MRSSVWLGAMALGLAVASAPALAQELSYGPSVPQLLSPNPFVSTQATPTPAPVPPTKPRRLNPVAAVVAPAAAVALTTRSAIDALIATHARANGVPESIVHKVVKRESRYNPRAVGLGGAMGLMQIKHATARAMGYSGPPAGLLDPETNITYAVRYLAGAIRAAGGDPDRGYALYRSGYYTSKKAARVAHTRRRDAPMRPDADTWGLHGER